MAPNDEEFCEGCGDQFDPSELNDEGLCSDCEEEYNEETEDDADQGGE